MLQKMMKEYVDKQALHIAEALAAKYINLNLRVPLNFLIYRTKLANGTNKMYLLYANEMESSLNAFNYYSLYSFEYKPELKFQFIDGLNIFIHTVQLIKEHYDAFL